MPDVPRNDMAGQVTTRLGRVSVNPCGTYQAEQTYQRLDIVEYLGSGWMALREVTGVTPTEEAAEDWMRYADNGGAATVAEARQYSEAASQSATEAEASADRAQTQAENASQSASTAQTAAETAQLAEGDASESARKAQEYSGNPPQISESETWEIWDAESQSYTDTKKPTRGEQGGQGDAGFSPTVKVEKQGKVTTITITDSEGPKTAEINDGLDGTGAGDMTSDVYDPDHHETDIFAEIGKKQDKLEWDQTPTAGSDKPVTSGGVYQAIQDITIEMDDTPQEESSNPVKSSGIYAALAGKQDTLTGEAGQVVGFDEAGKAKAVPLPETGYLIEATVESWQGTTAAISDPEIKAGDQYAYILALAAESVASYQGGPIWAEVAEDGTMTLHCSEAPEGSLVFDIIRLEVKHG